VLRIADLLWFGRLKTEIQPLIASFNGTALIQDELCLLRRLTNRFLVLRLIGARCTVASVRFKIDSIVRISESMPNTRFDSKATEAWQTKTHTRTFERASPPPQLQTFVPRRADYFGA
jgi:hypothetical protein